jgi:hypothetical protein
LLLLLPSVEIGNREFVPDFSFLGGVVVVVGKRPPSLIFPSICGGIRFARQSHHLRQCRICCTFRKFCRFRRWEIAQNRNQQYDISNSILEHLV